MWQDALAAHREGRARVVEVRASDYVGRQAQSMPGARAIPSLLAGKSVQVLGRIDQPHSWAYTRDVAATLVAAAAKEAAHGQAWMVPSDPARTQRQAIDDMADVARLARVNVLLVPTPILKALMLVNPTIRELKETLHQFREPFVVDDTATRSQLGVEPTPWREVLAATLESYRSPVSNS